MDWLEAISVNASNDSDPDFTILIDGMDVTEDCERWDISDDESQMSEISVTLQNKNWKYSGMFGYENEIAIRFGYVGNYGPPASAIISSVKESLGTGQFPVITVTGRDDMHKLCGGLERGKIEGKTDKEIIENVIKNKGLKPKVETPDGTRHEAPNMENKTPDQKIREHMSNIKYDWGAK